MTQTSVGKKALLALSGAVLFGFVIVHMLGNLQVFLGREAYNHYAEGVKGNLLVLWGLRGVLFVAFWMHVAIVVELYTKSAAARPVGYRKKKNIATTYAAATMVYSGPALLLYLLFHLAHFTAPGLDLGPYPFNKADVYTNFVSGFSVPWVAGVYVLANLFLGMHLFHGAFSLLQSLGLHAPRYNHLARRVARGFAFLVTAGNVVLPLSVQFGLVK